MSGATKPVGSSSLARHVVRCQAGERGTLVLVGCLTLTSFLCGCQQPVMTGTEASESVAIVEGLEDFAVTRTGEREATIRKQFAAAAPDVFAAMTKPSLIRQWLRGAGRLTVCEVDLRAGGSYRYVFELEDGSTFGVHGTYQGIVSNREVTYTEAYDGYDWDPLHVTTRFEEAGGCTTVTVTVLYPSVEVCDRDIRNLEHSEPEFERLEQLLGSSR